MDLTPESIFVYNWQDIQEKICEIMEIDFDEFRDYHGVIGGEYKDCWHVFLDHVIPDSMSNNTIVKLYYCDEEWLEIEKDDEWKLKPIRAWNQIYDSIGGREASGIYVSFNW